MAYADLRGRSKLPTNTTEIKTSVTKIGDSKHST
jgi:hypothetical protein